METFNCPVTDDLLFAAGTFAKIARDHGKSTKEAREAVRKATTLFLHYVVDYAAQQHQGSSDQRAVTIKPADIIKAVDELGFPGISRKLVVRK